LEYQKQEIKKGITMHNINTDKFKTNLIAIFLTTPLSKENVTFDAVLSAVLRRGSKNMPTQEEISKILEEMYGATFDCGLNKTGDNHILKFYLESVNDEYLPQDAQNMLKMSLEKLTEIVFNPYLENGKFKEEYLMQEKENISQRINAKKDNKAAYSRTRCVEEMYKNEPAGLYNYGYIEDLSQINSNNLYEYYQKLLNECKIDIFISGKVDKNKSTEIINQNKDINKLQPREPKYIINDIIAKEEVQEKNIEEKLDVAQGKIVIGCDIIFNQEDLKDKNLRYQAMLYNSLLRRKCKFQIISKCKRKSKLSIYSRFKLCAIQKQYIYNSWNRNREF
jgi:predicted Zn-dependent peptidase